MIVDGFVVVCFVAAALWVADKACNKLFPVNHYDDDDEDFEEFWNGLEHAEEEEEEEEYEEELLDGCEKKLRKKLEKSIVPCMQTRIRFADIDKVRVYTLLTGQSMRHTDSQTNQISRNWCPTRALLEIWIEFHQRNVFEVEPMDIDGPEDLIQGPAQPFNIQTNADARSTKRRRTDSGRPHRLPLAPSCAGASTFKRLKMTIPSSTKGWVQAVNSMHTPTTPVLIGELRNGALDQNSNDTMDDDDDDDLSLFSAFDDDEEDSFGDENDAAPTASHSPIITGLDDDDDLSLYSVFDDEEDDFGDENDTALSVSHSPIIAETDDDDDDDLSLFSAFDGDEDSFGDENDTAPSVSHSPIAGIENEVSRQDVANDQAVPPAESAGNMEASNSTTASIELGSGWTESGKRYSLRCLAKHNANEAPSLGSGMTDDGRRFSRRVASRQSTSAC